MRLRSVELEIPDVAPAAEFLERLWGLVPAGSAGATRFFRGAGDHPYILSLTQAAAPAVAAVTFAGSLEELAKVGRPDRSFDVPGGGKGFEVRGPERQVYRFITGPDDASFCHRVTAALNKGWEIYGSPSLTFNSQT